MDLRDRRIGVYWFSGSGNTLIVAKAIRDRLKELGGEVELYPLDGSESAKVDASAILGFVVPVAGQGTYPFVWEFLGGLPVAEGTPCFFVDTLGLYSGGILGPVRRILERKGYVPLAAKEILMPNIFQKRKADPEREKRLIDAGKDEAGRFCDSLAKGQGRWTDIPVYSALMSAFYRYRPLVSLWKKFFPWSVDGEKCRKCGICVRLCPERSLTMDAATGLPRNGESCSLCQRCFAFCPAGAIGIGNRKTVPYAAVSLEEMLKSLGDRRERPA